MSAPRRYVRAAAAVAIFGTVTATCLVVVHDAGTRDEQLARGRSVDAQVARFGCDVVIRPTYGRAIRAIIVDCTPPFAEAR